MQCDMHEIKCANCMRKMTCEVYLSTNVIFVISVSSLPDPLSSRFEGFKNFMQEEFFFSVARAKNLSLPVLVATSLFRVLQRL